MVNYSSIRYDFMMSICDVQSMAGQNDFVRYWLLMFDNGQLRAVNNYYLTINKSDLLVD